MSVIFGPLQAPGADGHTKDWVAVALADRLVIGYGRTGQVPRRSELPVAQCREGGTAQEGNRRMRDKIDSGYGRCDQPTPRMQAFIDAVTGGAKPLATAAAPDPAPADLTVFWELIPTTALDGRVHALLRDLQDAALLWRTLRDGDPAAAIEITSPEAMRLALQPPARSGGVATTPAGQLLLAVLAARLPAGELRLATADGTALDAQTLLRQASWTDTEPYRSLIERLGLGLTLAVTAAPVWFY